MASQSGGSRFFQKVVKDHFPLSISDIRAMANGATRKRGKGT